MDFPIVIQHRHIHLSQADAEVLFGSGVELIPVRPIGHRGQFLSEQTVDVIGKSGLFERVRILGPFRETTQVELSASDAFAIGIAAPVRVSGDLLHSGHCKLRSEQAEVKVSSQTIIPARHFHCNDHTARELGLSHHAIIAVELTQADAQTLEHVIVRVHPTFSNELHLSTDEAASLWIEPHHRIRLCLEKR